MEKPNISKEKKQRLFIGLAITPWLNELMKIQQTLKEKLQKMSHQIIWHPIESFHITLIFIGEVSEEIRKEIEENIYGHFLKTPFASFEIKATKISLLSSKHIIVALDAPLLNKLYEILHYIIPNFGKIKKERAYFAHIALAKLKNPHLAKNVYAALQDFKLNELPVLPINEFYLFESKPNRLYTPLATYILSSCRRC